MWREGVSGAGVGDGGGWGEERMYEEKHTLSKDYDSQIACRKMTSESKARFC